MESYKALKTHIYNEGIIIKKKTLKREEFLKVANVIDTNVYFIMNGSVRVFFVENLEEHTLYFGYRNSIITALDSFLSGQKTKLEIQALKKTEIGYLSKKEFMNFVNSKPLYLKLWNKVLEEIIMHQLDREKDLLLPFPEQRYQRVLKRMPELFQEIPHKYIASYLRMAPETLSRIKKS